MQMNQAMKDLIIQSLIISGTMFVLIRTLKWIVGGGI
jgi:hypothetical protein